MYIGTNHINTAELYFLKGEIGCYCVLFIENPARMALLVLKVSHSWSTRIVGTRICTCAKGLQRYTVNILNVLRDFFFIYYKCVSVY